jgi:hypothetical protein
MAFERRIGSSSISYDCDVTHTSCLHISTHCTRDQVSGVPSALVSKHGSQKFQAAYILHSFENSGLIYFDYHSCDRNYEMTEEPPSEFNLSIVHFLPNRVFNSNHFLQFRVCSTLTSGRDKWQARCRQSENTKLSVLF